MVVLRIFLNQTSCSGIMEQSHNLKWRYHVLQVLWISKCWCYNVDTSMSKLENSSIATCTVGVPSQQPGRVIILLSISDHLYSLCSVSILTWKCSRNWQTNLNMAHVATSYYTQLLTSANTVRTIWMLFVCYLSQSTLTSIATNLRWQSERGMIV